MGFARVGSNPTHGVIVMLPERLTGQTANLMGFARTSSNLVHNVPGN